MMANNTLKAAGAFLAALALSLPARALNHEDVVSPITAPRFAVACSNVEHDMDRLAALGGRPVDYWEGNTVNGSTRYVTDILRHPGTAVTFDPRVPMKPWLYPTRWFQPIEFAAIVCYPTSSDNTDANYVLPDNGGTVPKMQRPGEAPRIISANSYADGFGVSFSPPLPGIAKLPLIIYSHGLGGSPVGKGYLDVMTALASQGFMVAGVFHADARISPVRIEDLGDLAYTLAFFPLIVEMQAMRPFALKALADRLLLDQSYAVGIDVERIGGFGASLGGEAMAHLVGAKITSSLTRECSETETDPRIKAVVGYVPYSGWSFLPAFCDDQSGAESVDKPYLAIGGTLDTTAPINMTRSALNRMGSSRYLVELVGGQHELRVEDAGDVITWTTTFLNAYLRSTWDHGAMGRFIRMAQVTGGRPDLLTLDVHVPFANTQGESRAVEFWNEITNHYFMAAHQGEIDGILAGAAGPGWHSTGETFKVFTNPPGPDSPAGIAPVCRFYGVPAGGPNSHFFTASTEECTIVRNSPGWFYEGVGFYIRRVDANPRRCPLGLLSVNRAYNNRAAQNDSNHRFTTSDSTIREMGERGWGVEGTVMCARP
jgi:hypothetical protein